MSRSVEEILKALQAPTPPDDIKFLPKSIKQVDGHNGTALAIPHIDARFTQSRLDEACGPFNWQSEARECSGFLCVGIGIRNPETSEWLWKWDSGDEGKGDGKYGAKDKISGGLKRAGYLWGVGRDVYAYPTRRLKCKIYIGNDKKPKFRYWTENPLEEKRGFDDPPPREEEPPNDKPVGNGELDPEPEEVTPAQARRLVLDYAVTKIEMSTKEANEWIIKRENDALKAGKTVEGYKKMYAELIELKKSLAPPP